MNTFDAALHANKIRGNDGTGRFARQQDCESATNLACANPDFSQHERFEDADGNLLRLVHHVDGKVTDGPGGSPAVVKFDNDGSRIEKRYQDGVLHDGSGAHPSIARYRADGSLFAAERGYYKDTGHNRRFVEHDSADGQPASISVWEDRTSIIRKQNGRHISLDPAQPASIQLKADGSRQEDFHNSYGQRHDPAPGIPAVTGYHPDGSIAYTAFYENGMESNGPRGVHQEVFAEDGTLQATHQAVYDEADRYGYPRPEFRSSYYSPPRARDEILDSRLSDPEIFERLDANNHLTVRVRVPLSKQKSPSYLLAAGIYQSGFTQVSTVLAPIKRNRTVFDVVLDASSIVEEWSAMDRFGEGSNNPYWAARIAETHRTP